MRPGWRFRTRSTAGLLDRVDFIETVDTRDREANIASFAASGYDIIITVGAGMSEETLAVAGDFPALYFIGVQQSPEPELLPGQLRNVGVPRRTKRLPCGGSCGAHHAERTRGGGLRGRIHRFSPPDVRWIPQWRRVCESCILMWTCPTGRDRRSCCFAITIGARRRLRLALIGAQMWSSRWAKIQPMPP